MDGIASALSQMIVMLIIAGIGFAGTKAKVFERNQVSDITRMLLSITLPCMLLASVNSVDSVSVQHIVLASTLSVVSYLLSLACGFFCNVILRTPQSDRRMYLFMAVCTNTSFIGLPIISAVYGDQAVLLCSVFIMIQTFLNFSVGMGLITPVHEAKGRSIPWKSICNPATIACMVSIILVLLGYKFPPILYSALSMVGGITAPVAMLVVGIIVSGARIRDVIGEWRLYPVIAIRQLIVPALLFLVLQFFGVDPLLSGVLVIMFAMPVGSMAPALAQSVGQSPKLAAKGTILSTLAAFAVVPLLVLFMAM